MVKVTTQWYPKGSHGFPNTDDEGRLVLLFTYDDFVYTMVGSDNMGMCVERMYIQMLLDGLTFRFWGTEKKRMIELDTARVVWNEAQEKGFFAWKEGSIVLR